MNVVFRLFLFYLEEPPMLPPISRFLSTPAEIKLTLFSFFRSNFSNVIFSTVVNCFRNFKLSFLALESLLLLSGLIVGVLEHEIFLF